MLSLTACPEPGCDAVAETLDRFEVASTDGPLEIVKTMCVHRHWFLLPAHWVVVSLGSEPQRTIRARGTDG